MRLIMFRIVYRNRVGHVVCGMLSSPFRFELCRRCTEVLSTVKHGENLQQFAQYLTHWMYIICAYLKFHSKIRNAKINPAIKAAHYPNNSYFYQWVMSTLKPYWTFVWAISSAQTQPNIFTFTKNCLWLNTHHSIIVCGPHVVV